MYGSRGSEEILDLIPRQIIKAKKFEVRAIKDLSKATKGT